MNIHLRKAHGWLVLVGVAALALGAARPVQADFFLITDRAAVGAADSVNWSTLGPAFTVVPQPFSITSTAGQTLTVSQMTNPFERRDQGFPSGGWDGDFAPGDPLLWTRGTLGSSGPIVLDFGPGGITAGGAQIQPDIMDGSMFTARITALDDRGNVLASFTETGLSTNAADNSAIFLGIGSDNTPISELMFSLDVASSPPGDFAINQVDFASSVPAPGGLVLAGIGAVGLLVYRCCRRRAMSAS